ncbi:MAG TPA: carboxylating nicotinate-nucleotide diphosphorylase [Candidatus Kryptonia bacterium]
MNSILDRPTTATVQDEITSIVRRALVEDIGTGDVTTESIVPTTAVVRGRFIAKTEGVIAGWEIAEKTFCLLDNNVRVVPLAPDGTDVQKGEMIGTISGPGRAILTGERVALNFLQRMSGIATTSRHFVRAVAGTRAVVLDTRKTVPGLRILDKMAVKIGGAQNHRAGLFDMILVKDNHIAQAGGIFTAVERARAHAPKGTKIEVEVRHLDELREVLTLNVDRILLDNMSVPEMAAAVDLVAGRTELEASGNIDMINVAAVAATGVNYISIGALTHSVTVMDISLMIDR